MEVVIVGARGSCQTLQSVWRLWQLFLLRDQAVLVECMTPDLIDDHLQAMAVGFIEERRTFQSSKEDDLA